MGKEYCENCKKIFRNYKKSNLTQLISNIINFPKKNNIQSKYLD